MMIATRFGNRRPRDENGWVVPRNGTKSAKIYAMLKEGKPPTMIARELNANRNGVKVLAHSIKNPDKHNANVQKYAHK
jgi:hypothetical protein